MFFLDKRSKNGELLVCESHRLNQKITKRYINTFKKSFYYKLLSNYFSEKLIVSYFQKKFFYENRYVFNQITINKYDGNQHQKIIFDNKEQKKIIKIFNKNFKRDSLSTKRYLRNFFTLIKPFYYTFLKLKNIKKNKNNLKTPKIAVSLVDGIDPKLRSDIFWETKIEKKNNILIYIEAPHLLRKFQEHLPYIKSLKKKGVSIVNIWEEDNNIENFKKLNFELDKIKTKNLLESHFKSLSIDLVKKLNFWINFFTKYNIKIHIDSDDLKIDNIVKQIALEIIGSCSVGKIKSYISPHCSLFFDYYHNDVFFCWGKKLVRNIKVMKKKGMISNLNNLIISGNLNQDHNKDYKTKIFNLKKNFKKKGIKKIILVLDTTFSDNKNFREQAILTQNVNYFYNKVLDLGINDKKIFLLIKPKKGLNDLDSTVKLKIEKLLDEKRIYIEKDSRKPVHLLSKISDFAVALTVDSLPTALLESISENRYLKGVFYDFPRCSSKEKISSWGKNKVSFTNQDKMFKELSKSLYSKSSKVGVWSKKFRKNLNPFEAIINRDKVKFYIFNLLEQFKIFKNKKKCIKKVNELFKKKYGNYVFKI